MSRHYSHTHLIFRRLCNKSKRIQWNSRQSVYCVRFLMDIQLTCSGRSTFWLQITLLTAFLRDKEKNHARYLDFQDLVFYRNHSFYFDIDRSWYFLFFEYNLMINMQSPFDFLYKFHIPYVFSKFIFIDVLLALFSFKIFIISYPLATHCVIK